MDCRLQDDVRTGGVGARGPDRDASDRRTPHARIFYPVDVGVVDHDVVDGSSGSGVIERCDRAAAYGPAAIRWFASFQ